MFGPSLLARERRPLPVARSMSGCPSATRPGCSIVPQKRGNDQDVELPVGVGDVGRVLEEAHAAGQDALGVGQLLAGDPGGG